MFDEELLNEEGFISIGFRSSNTLPRLMVYLIQQQQTQTNVIGMLVIVVIKFYCFNVIIGALE